MCLEVSMDGNSVKFYHLVEILILQDDYKFKK